MIRIEGEWIVRPATQRVCAMLTGAGYQVFFVGGCVRNALMGLPVTDVDIATSARPEEVAERAVATGIRCLPTGISHGTVTLLPDGIAHEVTTFRQDVSTDGRRAVVSFSDNIREDAERRDFTINALYAAPDGTVSDPLGGMDDVLRRRIAFIGDADARIREDYLRILRFFRMHALYGNRSEMPDRTAILAIARNLGGIGQLSKERVTREMSLLLGAEEPATALAAMEESGALGAVLPGASAALVEALTSVERQFRVSPDWVRRLVLLGDSNHETHLRLSRKEIRQLNAIALALVETCGPAQLAQRFGVRAALSAVLVRAARGGGRPDPDLMEELARGVAAEFPVRARDLMKYGLNGPDLGVVLKNLREAWIASDMRLSRSQLLSDFAAAP